jgi:DNA polymerase-4
MRWFLHIEMDAFFSSVWQERYPELVGKPIAVGGEGDLTKRGVVSTASNEVRRFRIHSAIPLRTVYRFCPNAFFSQWIMRNIR